MDIKKRKYNSNYSSLPLGYKPSAPEISREISFNLSLELGHHEMPGNNASLPATGNLLGDEHAQKVHKCFSKRFCFSPVRPMAVSFRDERPCKILWNRPS